MEFFGSSLWICYKLAVVAKKLSLYSIRLYIGITISKSFTSCICVLLILVVYSVDKTEFLNITFLLFLSACIAAASAPCPIRVMASLTSMHASL